MAKKKTAATDRPAPKASTKVSKKVSKKVAANKAKKAGAAKSTRSGGSGAKAAPASDGRTVAAYVGALGGWQRGAAERLRQIVRAAAPDAVEVIKWGQPVFEHNGPFAYLKAFSEHINFGFWRGASLADPKGLIVSGGDRMGHVRIASIADIDDAALTALVREAVKLNDELGNPARTR